MHELRPIFLGISIITLMLSTRRDGFDGRNIARAIICAGLLAWTYSSQVVWVLIGAIIVIELELWNGWWKYFVGLYLRVCA